MVGASTPRMAVTCATLKLELIAPDHQRGQLPAPTRPGAPIRLVCGRNERATVAGVDRAAERADEVRSRASP